MAMTQQELKPQPRDTPDDDLDEMYEEEPRRRAWGAIASVVLALALVFVGYQWNQAATRAEAVGAQVNGLRAEAETQRLRAEDAQRQVDVIQKRLAAISAEKDSLAERIVSLEKTGGVAARGGEDREAGEAEVDDEGDGGRAPTGPPEASSAASRPSPTRATSAPPPYARFSRSSSTACSSSASRELASPASPAEGKAHRARTGGSRRE